MTVTDPTLDPGLESRVPVAPGSDFPIQNLPYGIFSTTDRPSRVGVAIGDQILDLSAAASAGHLDGITIEPAALNSATLNPLMDQAPDRIRALRERISRLLRADREPIGDLSRCLVPRAHASMHLPCRIGDFVDFYSSIEHATNLGRMFRPDTEPLLPNWRHLPVGYHGRASTVVVSGTPVVRPRGQRKRADQAAPSFGPSERLDFELEVGFFTTSGPNPGTPTALRDADDHIFGFVLVNDWSARDLQAWEYVPLGPFLGKSFATTVSPWVVTRAALAPFRVTPPAQEPVPLPYLSQVATTGVSIELEVDLNGTVVSSTNLAGMYWTPAQQLAHVSSNGTLIRTGDLYASGTISGPTAGSQGSLIELTDNAVAPITLADGTTRGFLEDGDTVTLRGRAVAEGSVSIGFGSNAGTIAP